jgi:hypothetical protein
MSPSRLRSTAGSARTSQTRRGGVYVAVLGVSMLVAVIGLAAMASMRVQRRSAATANAIAQARLNAIAAVEIGANWVNDNSSSWRTLYTAAAALNTGIAGTITMPSGTGKATLSDPIDSNITNRPTDPVIVLGVGNCGQARQMFQVQLNPVGTPIDALLFAISTPGAAQIDSSKTLTLSGAPMLSTTLITVNGTLSGSVQALLKLGLGSVTGTWSIPSTVFAMPSGDPIAIYTALGTAISPGTNVQNMLLGPGVSTSTATDPDGVYVITSSSNVTIQNIRLLGTLVVHAPGKTVQITSNVFMSPSRSDYPVLIVEGNLDLKFDGSSGQNLSESSNGGINFNPPGAPYNGVTNTTTNDTYPSTIMGLIHVRGNLTFSGKASVTGAIIVESSDVLSAVRVSSNAQVTYDPNLYANPPMGYAKQVRMVPAAGTWAQVVTP